jgi:hypothetical protein
MGGTYRTHEDYAKFWLEHLNGREHLKIPHTDRKVTINATQM